MIDRRALLADLRRRLKRLEQDLAERSESVQEMKSALEAEYRAARDAERTGDTFRVWRAGALTQAAVAWLARLRIRALRGRQRPDRRRADCRTG